MADWNKSLIVVAVKELKTKPRFSSVWFPLAVHTQQGAARVDLPKCLVCLSEYWQIYSVYLLGMCVLVLGIVWVMYPYKHWVYDL